MSRREAPCTEYYINNPQTPQLNSYHLNHFFMSHLTLILVPGAWHSPATWSKIISSIPNKCISITLSTTRGDSTLGFSDDVRCVRDAIVSEISQGRKVVVVVHSYGGTVGASAVRGLENGVVGIFMIATGFAVSGLTFLDALGGKPPPIWTMNKSTGFAEIKVDVRQLFYHDLPPQRGEPCGRRDSSLSLPGHLPRAPRTHMRDGWMCRFGFSLRSRIGVFRWIIRGCLLRVRGRLGRMLR